MSILEREVALSQPLFQETKKLDADEKRQIAFKLYIHILKSKGSFRNLQAIDEHLLCPHNNLCLDGE